MRTVRRHHSRKQVIARLEGKKIIGVERRGKYILCRLEENEVLAGALSKVELGDEIPAELYKAVAEVLIFVLRLSGRVR